MGLQQSNHVKLAGHDEQQHCNFGAPSDCQPSDCQQIIDVTDGGEFLCHGMSHWLGRARASVTMHNETKCVALGLEDQNNIILKLKNQTKMLYIRLDEILTV